MMTATLPSTITQRVERLDWAALTRDLDARGYAVTPRILAAEECAALIALFGADDRFRKTVDMSRLQYGSGVYRYFANPLPAPVRELREAFYPPLARVANDWARKLRAGEAFPDTLGEFLAHCHAHGQARPTPLLLHYAAGDYNALHQDIYGEVGFPFQLLTVLSRREADYTGGEFLLVTQRPRAQSVGEAITLEQGEVLIFPNRHRPLPRKAGWSRGTCRHGVSPLRAGERYALGVIFHDAK